MILSKKVVIVFGVGCIFFLAFLNRLNVVQKSEKVNAYAQRVFEDDDTQYYLSFTYNGTPHYHIIENTVSLKNNTTYKLLIKNGNPNDFLVYNFMGFWFIALLIACVVVSGWVVFSQVLFDNILNFKFLLWEKSNETKLE